MNNQKVAELFENEAFVNELETKTSAEDAQALFASHGAEISVAELKAMRIAAKQEAGEELGEDELELVAGGVVPIVIGTVVGRRVVSILRRW